jgi:hypothetical protein
MGSLYTHIMTPYQFLEFLDQFMILLIFFVGVTKIVVWVMFSKTLSFPSIFGMWAQIDMSYYIYIIF